MKAVKAVKRGGIPIQCAVRVLPSSRSKKEADILIDSSRVSIIPPPESRRTKVEEYSIDAGFGPDSTSQDQYDKVLGPLIPAVVEGMSGSILLFGATGTGKSFALEGERHGDAGFVDLLAHGLFGALMEKAKQLSGGTRRGMSPRFTYDLRMTYLEIFDETLTDLLNTSNRDLDLYEDEDAGVAVKNITVRSVKDAEEFLELFTEGRGCRTDLLTDYGNAADKAASVLTLELIQTTVEDRDGDLTSMIRSKLVLIDLPGNDKIMDDPEALRIKEGPTMNKSIISFAQLVKSLSGSDSSVFVNYRQSLLTFLCEDILGGNCITIVIGTLKMGDYLRNTNTLKMLSLMRDIENFPLVNDQRVQGLIRKFRVEMMTLREELMVVGKSSVAGAAGGMSEQDQILKINELEGRLIRENLEKVKIQDEKRKLTDRVTEFRTKYNELVSSKAEQQAALIKSEEERLTVSRALIDLQIENTSLLEKVDAEKYELTSKILYLENSSVEGEMKESRTAAQIKEYKDLLEKTLREKKELEIEFVALKANFLNVNEQLTSELNKNEEIGLQLLHLVNIKNTLQSERDAAMSRKGDLDSNVNTMERRLGTLENENRRLEAELRNSRIENETIKANLFQSQLEIQKSVHGYEQQMTELERTLLAEKRNKEGLSTAQGAFDRSAKASVRRIEELEKLLEETQEKEGTWQREYDALVKKFDQARENFRARLHQYAQNSTPDGRLPPPDFYYQESLRSYQEQDRELAMQRQSDSSRIRQLEKEMRALKTYAIQLRHLAEDWAPTGQQLPETIRRGYPTRADELDVATDANQKREVDRLNNRVRQLEDQMARVHAETIAQYQTQINQLRNRLNDAEKRAEGNDAGYMGANGQGAELSRLRDDNRRLTDQIRSLQSSGDAAEKEAELQAEIIRLTAQIQTLNSQIRSRSTAGAALGKETESLKEELIRLQDENSVLQQQIASSNAADPKQVAQLRSTIQQLEEKLREAPARAKPQPVGEADETSGFSKRNLTIQSSKEVMVLKEENAKLQVKIRELEQTAGQGGGFTAANSNTTSTGTGAERLLKQKIVFLENTIKDLEKERSELTVRATMAEEQLSQLQEHMNSTISNYQKKLVEMKKQVILWKKKAGVPDTEST